MKLIPYPDERERWWKVCKHVFNKEERWWEITRDLPQWHQDWKVLHAEGCLNGEKVYLPEKDKVQAVVTRNHTLWLHAAEQACDQARASQRVYPTNTHRVRYVGDGGVIVIATERSDLVTCFRSGGGRSRVGDEERVSRAEATAQRRSGFPMRAAVRRSEKQASLGRAKPATAGSERDDA